MWNRLCFLTWNAVLGRGGSEGCLSLGLERQAGADGGSQLLLILLPRRAHREGEMGAIHSEGNNQELQCCLMPASEEPEIKSRAAEGQIRDPRAWRW